jgi:hypothetical protein
MNYLKQEIFIYILFKIKAAFLEITPLADLTEYIDDKLWIWGNRTLINLNLSSILFKLQLFD